MLTLMLIVIGIFVNSSAEEGPEPKAQITVKCVLMDICVTVIVTIFVFFDCVVANVLLEWHQ